MTLPVTLRRTPEEFLPIAVALMVLMAVASVTAWLGDPRLGRRGRNQVGWGLVALGTLSLLVVAYLAVPERPEHALPFAAGVAVSVAPVRRTMLRLPVQVLVVVGMAGLLLAAGRPWPETALVISLLTYVVWLSGVLAGSLVDARRSQLEARVAAERRAALLATVRELSGGSAAQAASTVVDSLRSLGLTVAGVSVVRNDFLVPLALEGLPPASGRRLGEGIAGTAVVEDTTLVSEDYARDDRRLPDREGLGAVIAVPVRIAGRAVGVLLGGRPAPGPLPDEIVEVAEVLASHLGGVLETEQRIGRQREFLERMRALEDMRGRLVTDVSEEIRDPLTVVRGIAETLGTHGERLPADRRMQLLKGFEDQAGALRETIDALLDFSRLQASRPLAVPGLLTVGELVPTVVSSGVVVEGDADAVVRTDAVLFSRALELLEGLGPVHRVHVAADEATAWVRLELDLAHSSPRERLVLGLAERLVISAGGRWSLGDGSVAIGLERAVVEAPGATA